MATTKRTKANIEFLLVKAELKGIHEKGLLKSRNIGQVDLIWPRAAIAKKSGAREMVFKKGVCDFAAEPWTKRVIFREEVDGRCGLAVSITEPVSIQKVRRFLRLTAKYALKMGADFMEKALMPATCTLHNADCRPATASSGYSDLMSCRTCPKAMRFWTVPLNIF